MTFTFANRRATLVVLALVACGAEQARSSGGEEPVEPGRQVRACEVLDLAGARQVIGAGAEHPGGDTEPLTCMYSSPGVAVLTVQLGTAEWYDQMTIMPPHTAVEIGDRGRYNVQETGAVAVQFVAGKHSVTLSVQPIGVDETDYLEPLLSGAREAAGRLR